MSRLGITFEQVESMAEALLAEGKHPTIERIRHILGGTGSNSTISKHLRAWRLTRPSLVTIQGISPPDPVNAAVNRVWQEIQTESASQIQAIKEKAATDVAAANAEQQLMKEAHDHLLKERDSLQSLVHQLVAEKEILSLDFKAEQQQRLLLEERCQKINEHYQTLQQESAAHLAEIKALHQQETQRLLEQIESVRKDCEKYSSEIKNHAESTRQRHIVEMDACKTDQQKQKKEMAQLTLQTQALETQLAEHRVNLQSLIRERDQAIQSFLEQEKKMAAQEKKLQISENHWAEWKAWQSIEKNEFEQAQKNRLAQDKHFLWIEQLLQSIHHQLNQQKIST